MGTTVAITSVVLAISVAFAAYLYSLPAHLHRLDGQRVLVTGSSSGLGAALATHYASLGADLLLTGRREKPLRQVADRCRRAGSPRVQILAGDLTDELHRSRLVAEAKKMGGLDQLLLNHAAVAVGPWLGSDGNLTALSNAMAANFASHADLALKALPLLKASAGRLGVVSSLASKAPPPLLAVYAASKAAQRGFFAALRQELELEDSNVSVTTFVLGAVATDAHVALQERYFHWINMFAAASPEDAARAIVSGVWRRDAEITYPLLAQIQQVMHAAIPEIYEYNWNHITS